MKDRRVIALERVLSRRKDLDRKLAVALTGLRGAHTQLTQTLEARRALADDQGAEVVRQGRKIDEMLSGAFRADEFLTLQDFHAAAAQRHVGLQSEARQAADAVAQKASEIEKERCKILQNRARIDIYGDRRDLLRKGIASALEEAEDEEAAESWRKPMQTMGSA